MSQSEEPTDNGSTEARRRDQDGNVGRVPGERTLVDGLLRYIGIVWRYKWFVIGVTAIAAIGSVTFAIISLRLPPEQSPLPNYYRANAVLLQQRGAGDSVTATLMASLGMQGPRGGVDHGQIALSVLRSRDFVDRIVEQNGIIERYGIQGNVRTVSRGVVAGRSTFSYDQRTGMLQIVYQDIDPRFAAGMVESIVDELILWFSARGGSDQLLALQTMEEKLTEVEDRIREIEQEIEQFQRQHGALRIEEIAQTQTELLSGLQTQLIGLDLQIANREQVSRIANDPELVTMRSQQQNILNLMDRIRDGYTGGRDSLPPRDQLPVLSAQYARLQMDLGIQARILQALTERYEVARLTADTDPAFSILVPVEVPEEKAGPRRGDLVVAATAGGFLGSIVLALMIHGLRTILRDPEKRRLLKEAQQ